MKQNYRNPMKTLLASIAFLLVGGAFLMLKSRSRQLERTEVRKVLGLMVLYPNMLSMAILAQNGWPIPVRMLLIY